jgi:DNA-binding IclR family transcriptional regulator
MNQLFASLKPLGLLEAVAGMPHSATLAELAASVGVPKPTMHRWLAALEGAGLLQRTLDGRRFAACILDPRQPARRNAAP